MKHMLKISAVYLIGNPKRVTLLASISENPVPLFDTLPHLNQGVGEDYAHRNVSPKKHHGYAPETDGLPI